MRLGFRVSLLGRVRKADFFLIISTDEVSRGTFRGAGVAVHLSNRANIMAYLAQRSQILIPDSCRDWDPCCIYSSEEVGISKKCGIRSHLFHSGKLIFSKVFSLGTAK